MLFFYFYRSGRYRKLTSKKQEENFLSEHPLESPVRREKLKPASDHNRPTTWFNDHTQPARRTSNIYQKQISEDFSKFKYPKTNLRKSPLTASEPFLASGSVEQKDKHSRVYSRLFSFGFAKLKEKTTKRPAVNLVRYKIVLLQSYIILHALKINLL